MNITRLPIRLTGDDRRVIARPFILGAARAQSLLNRISELDEPTVEKLLTKVRADFGTRHLRTDELFEEHFRMASRLAGWKDGWTPSRSLLAGAYFTMEYSVDSAALFNPSIVAHPDQSGVPAGALRFVMSLRATGEGHVSSVVFRTGLITVDNEVQIDPPPERLHRARFVPDRTFDRPLFSQKLREIGINRGIIDAVVNKLNESFTLQELTIAVEDARQQLKDVAGSNDALRTMNWLASSNYHISLEASASLSELVIFPMSEEESHGIEDLRLVQFHDDNQQMCYYGTYTAYDGVRTLPMMIHTRDFHRVEVHSLNGPGAANKGLALFPRKIGGRFVMCARIDGENLYINTSDSAYFWDSAKRLVAPRFPWEFVQLGNCGSPLETDDGWLLLTHGVGPMRTYAIGALLLDRDDPLKVLGYLPEPLITADDHEREGYVPNVVYTCGAIIHTGRLFIPYAQADKSTSLAVVDLNELLDRLTDHAPA
ncbi:MAG TPA: glycoside hydrolase family 130 protein [Tepidisphaeraceae bacterium]|jgi:predicted GH43/DUF377 family glycosyl hydrolase